MNIMAGTNKITKVSIEVFMLMISMVLSQSNTTTMKMEFIMLMQPLNKLLIQMLGNGTWHIMLMNSLQIYKTLSKT